MFLCSEVLLAAKAFDHAIAFYTMVEKEVVEWCILCRNRLERYNERKYVWRSIRDWCVLQQKKKALCFNLRPPQQTQHLLPDTHLDNFLRQYTTNHSTCWTQLREALSVGRGKQHDSSKAAATANHAHRHSDTHRPAHCWSLHLQQCAREKEWACRQAEDNQQRRKLLLLEQVQSSKWSEQRFLDIKIHLHGKQV